MFVWLWNRIRGRNKDKRKKEMTTVCMYKCTNAEQIWWFTHKNDFACLRCSVCLQEVSLADTLQSEINQCKVQQTSQLCSQAVALLINNIKLGSQLAEWTRKPPFNWRALLKITPRRSTVPPQVSSNKKLKPLFGWRQPMEERGTPSAQNTSMIRKLWYWWWCACTENMHVTYVSSNCH